MDRLYESEDAVEELLHMLFELHDDKTETEVEFINRLRDEFDVAHVPLADPGIPEPTIDYDGPWELISAGQSLHDFIHQLAESITLKTWLSG